MTKLFGLLGLIIGAVIVIAAPVSASAAPALTMPAGTLVPVGKQITGDSTNSVTVTPLGSLECFHVAINFQVTQNSGTWIGAWAPAGSGFASLCELGGRFIQINNIELSSFSSTVSGKGTADLAFVAHLPGELTCHFKSAFPGTPVTYTAGSSSLHLAGELEANPEICGEAGEVAISGDFALSTWSSSGAVILD